MASEMRIRPFYSGTQKADWSMTNCHNCWKSEGNADERLCEIESALDKAYFGDGTVDVDIARRMGYKTSWVCPELVAIRPVVEHVESLMPKPTRLAPLWWRIIRASRLVQKLWDPWWRPEVDIYGMPGRVSLRTAWQIAWKIWRDARWRVEEVPR